MSIDSKQLLGGGAALEPAPAGRMKEIVERVTEIVADVRRLSYELHPAKLGAIGLVASLEALCRDTSMQHRLAVEFTHRDVPARVSADVSLCLYRVAQEALHNVVRHSGATQASVRIARESDALTLQIADQGVGFSLVDVDRAGFGLISMQERISFLGGDVAIHSLARRRHAHPRPRASLRRRAFRGCRIRIVERTR